MSSPVPTSDFLANLAKSGVLTEDRITRFMREHSLQDEEEAREVALRFIQEGVLTRFQAERVLIGRYRGLVIDGYVLQEILGAGGMGWVYIAREADSDWKVAIKVMSSLHRDNRGMMSRFQMEAQAGMRLKHPNILRTFSLNKSEDSHGEFDYMVMEFIPGVSPLEMLLLQGKIDWKQACDIGRQTAVGLHYAHQQGLIHRDVKPENLLIRSNGAVKILDFGLAMFDENDEEFTMAMIFGQNRLGTADFVAPEQTVNSYEIDQRADVYGLGCTLFYLLTGQVPFPGETSKDKIKMHRQQAPPSVRTLRPEIPEKVDLIVRKMMAKQVENRISTCEDVAKYLAPFSEQKEVIFDFSKVLRARVKQARMRISKRSKSQRHLTGLTTLGQAEAALDTKLREDTKLNPLAKGATNPGQARDD